MVSRADSFRRDGYVLLTVLWMSGVLAILALSVGLEARRALLESGGRVSVMQGRWLSEACSSRLQAVLLSRLQEGRGEEAVGTAWRALSSDSLAALLHPQGACRVSIRPAGAGFDVNSGDAVGLRRLLAHLGIPSSRSDSLSDAILDWIDKDSVPRPRGAEAQWYRARHLPEPSNRDIHDRRGLTLIRGLGNDSLLVSHLDVEASPPSLNQSPMAVLASIPGVSREALLALGRIRSEGRDVPNFGALYGVSPSIGSRLSSSTVLFSEKWLIVVSGLSGRRVPVVSIELLLGRRGRDVVVHRKRMYLE